jgi:acetolactate synthase I/II/III large subunit
MNSQEMETAIRLKLNLVVMVIRDDAYGMIRWKQAAGGFHDWGLELGNPDFVAYANSYGAQGHRIESTDQLLPILEQAYREGGVHLVDVPVDYSENKRVLIDGLANVDCGPDLR